ncbi:MAG: VWA domain-containing protein [Treponema sp.]|jgi:hypothetical protein|nr:VWA domain-containing protein [Treponema sp.]
MKHKLSISRILGLLLVFGVFLFTGCSTVDNGSKANGNSNDSGTIVETDPRGFLDILYDEIENNEDLQEGVYVGIISFAGDAKVITEPVRLDATGYKTLKDKITRDYTRATTGGTSLFIAVNRALANLKEKESTYPANLDTVSIITFTDGLDNQSLAVLANPNNWSSPNYQLEGKTYEVGKPESAGAYMDYIKGQIATRTIAGHTIKAYAVGVQGSDVTDTASFEAGLRKIASDGTDESGVSYFTKLTNFATLKETFQKIAEGLNNTYTITNIVMTTTQSDAGTTYRWTFDAAGADSAEKSTKYIEATIAIDSTSGVYSLTQISYAGGITTAQGAGPLEGILNEGKVDFIFTNVTGYDAYYNRKPKQWIKSSNATAFRPESEIDSTGNMKRTIDHKTAVIYLVLDASTSLSASNINDIKAALSSESY